MTPAFGQEADTFDPTSVAAYVQDYECLIEGIGFFIKLQKKVVENGNIDAIRRHYEQNPEDKLCDVFKPGTREMVLCRRSGIDAIKRMSLRLISEAPNGCDLSAKHIAEIIV